MNGRTAKLLRKTSGGNKYKYKMIKRAITAAPRPIRAQAIVMARDLATVETNEAKINKELSNAKQG